MGATNTIFFYLTAFCASKSAIFRMVRLPLVAAGLAVPFRVVIFDDAAAKTDFFGLSHFQWHH
jgi:hypothetical protein